MAVSISSACTIIQIKGRGQTVIMPLMLLIMMMGAAVDGARAMQYAVGGAAGWALGNDLEQWASQYTFHVGDDLYFRYPAGQSIVLLVTEEDYQRCRSDHPVASDGGKGNMVMSLMDPDITYYFISGNEQQCSEGLRIAVPVHEAQQQQQGQLQPPPPPPHEDGTSTTPAVILTPPAGTTPSNIGGPDNNNYNTGRPYGSFRNASPPPPHCTSCIITVVLFSSAAAAILISFLNPSGLIYVI